MNNTTITHIQGDVFHIHIPDFNRYGVDKSYFKVSLASYLTPSYSLGGSLYNFLEGFVEIEVTVLDSRIDNEDAVEHLKLTVDNLLLEFSSGE